LRKQVPFYKCVNTSFHSLSATSWQVQVEMTLEIPVPLADSHSIYSLHNCGRTRL